MDDDIGILCGLTAEANVMARHDGFRIYCNKTGYAQLQQEYKQLSALIAFGTCGGLTSAYNVGDLYLGSLVHTDNQTYTPDYEWFIHLCKRASELFAARGVKFHVGPLYSSEIEQANTPEQRLALWEKWHTPVVEVESSLVAPLAKDAGIPFAVIRAISDDWQMTVPDGIATVLNADGSNDIEGVLSALIKDPSDIIPLEKLAQGLNSSLNTLDAFRDIAIADIQRLFGT